MIIFPPQDNHVYALTHAVSTGQLGLLKIKWTSRYISANNYYITRGAEHEECTDNYGIS
jgi:hypothetical protein